MIPALDWNPEWEWGEARIDQQHRGLVDRINRFALATSEVQEADGGRAMLSTLLIYAEAHFRYEEQVMEARGHPDLEAHRAAHQACLQHIEALHTSFWEQGTVPHQALVAFLHFWLTEHLEREDRAACGYLKGATGTK